MGESRSTIRKVSRARWEKAQEFELASALAKGGIAAGDDWNRWWSRQFDNYSGIARGTYENILEVGCGPHTNLRLILPLVRFNRVYLEDPLIMMYLLRDFVEENTLLCRVRSLLYSIIRRGDLTNHVARMCTELRGQMDLSSARLEELPYRNESMDLVVCINVLDHVNDYDSCAQEITRVLKVGGTLVIGQDLSNEEDRAQCPRSYGDVGHPIKLNDATIDQSFAGYRVVSKKMLAREEGRNPAAHYATYLGVFIKT